MGRGRRPAPRNVVKWDVGRPAPRPPRTFALMRIPADCVVGGGVPDAPRRGQDPSLRCKGYRGGNGEAAGRACPAPFPLTGCRGRLRAAYMPPLQRCCSPLRGFGGAWRRTTSAASLLRKHARAVDCPAGAIIVRSPVSLRSTVAPRAQPRTASKQRQFSLVLSFAAKRKNKFPGGCR